MSSAKQTDSQGENKQEARSPQNGPPVQATLVRWIVVGTVLIGGWGAILLVNRWHLTPGVVFLLLGWMSVLLIALYLWRAGWTAAEDSSELSDEEFWRPAGRRDELEAEKRSLLKAIKEIEFDHGMGKMSDADADELTRYYRARAIDLIKALESEGADDAELSIAELIERDVQVRLKLKKKRANKDAAIKKAKEASS